MLRCRLCTGRWEAAREARALVVSGAYPPGEVEHGGEQYLPPRQRAGHLCGGLNTRGNQRHGTGKWEPILAPKTDSKETQIDPQSSSDVVKNEKLK